MESVQMTEKFSWVTDKIKVLEFRNKWQDYPLNEGEINLKELTMKTLGITEKEFEELELECCEETLDCDFECTTGKTTQELIDLPDWIDLETLKQQKSELIKRHNDIKYSQLVYNNTKFSRYFLSQTATEKNSSCNVPKFKPVDFPEIVLTVQIYRPEKEIKRTKIDHYHAPNFWVEHEIEVLGCQYLTELRDVIECLSDDAIPGEFSEIPVVTFNITCKDLYKSGFFFINDTFYNDMRDRNCRDYSLPIMNWAASDPSSDIGPLSKALMEQTRFIDLELRLGYPYLYLHQSYCEHLLVISDICILEDHNANRAEYPRYVSVKPKRSIECMVCQINCSKWIIYDNVRLPSSPFFSCDDCFKGFNYTKDNQKIGDFRAYYYPDKSLKL